MTLLLCVINNITVHNIST